MYLIKRPLILWNKKVSEKSAINEFKKNRLLFWVNDALDINDLINVQAKIDQSTKELVDCSYKGEDNFIEDEYLISPTLFFIKVLKLQIKKFNLLSVDSPDKSNLEYDHYKIAKNYLSYYKKTIVYPVTSFIYRTILFYKDYNTTTTYYIYELVLCFLISYGIFINDLLDKTKFPDFSEVVEANKTFCYFKPFKTEKDLEEIYAPLRDHIYLMKNAVYTTKQRDYDPTEIDKIFDILNQHIDFLNVCIAPDAKNVDSNEVEETEVSTTKTSNSTNYFEMLYADYLAKKSDTDNWVIRQVIENTADIKSDDYIRLISQLFIINLYYDIYYFQMFPNKYIEYFEFDMTGMFYKQTKEYKNIRRNEDIKKNMIESIKAKSDIELKREMFLFDVVIKITTRIIKINPKVFQHILLKDFFFITKLREFYIPYINHIYPYGILKNFFDTYESSSIQSINVLIDVIEFLRMLCEEHNEVFQAFIIEQTILMGDEGDKLVNFLLETQMSINSVLEFCLPQMKKLKVYQKVTVENYFIDLYRNISNFFIEIVQGSTSYVYLTCLGKYKRKDSNQYIYESWLESNYKLLTNFVLNYRVYYKYLQSFMELVNAIFGENSSMNESILSNINEAHLYMKENNIDLFARKVKTKAKENEDNKEAIAEDPEKKDPAVNLENNKDNNVNFSNNVKNDIFNDNSAEVKKTINTLDFEFETVFPDPVNYHFVTILRKMNIRQIYYVCKKSLEIAYMDAFSNNKFDEMQESMKKIMYNNKKTKIKVFKNYYIDAYKYNEAFTKSDFLKISFTIFKYINMVSLNPVVKPTEADDDLDEFLKNIQQTTENFLDILKIENKDDQYIFLDRFINTIEVVDIFSDLNISEMINNYQNSFLNINLDQICGNMNIKYSSRKKAFFLRQDEKILVREIFILPPQCYSLNNFQKYIEIAESKEDASPDKILNILNIIPEISEMLKRRYDHIICGSPSTRSFLYFLFENEDNFIYYGGFFSIMLSYIVNGFVLKNVVYKQILIPIQDIDITIKVINYIHIAYNAVFLLILIAYNVILKFGFIQCKSNIIIFLINSI